MAYNTKEMLKDAKGKVISQVYDADLDQYVPLTTQLYRDVEILNFPDKQDVQITGNNLQEQLTQADAASGTLTFSDTITEVEIFNRDLSDGVFTVNGIAITVPPGESFQSRIGGTPSAEVTVTGSTDYIVGRYA